MKEQVDQHHTERSSDVSHSELSPRFHGPFKVIHRLKTISYSLEFCLVFPKFTFFPPPVNGEGQALFESIEILDECVAMPRPKFLFINLILLLNMLQGKIGLL